MASRQDDSGERWSRGLAAYASQFGIPEDEVFAHLLERFGERFATEAVNAAAGAWTDEVLTLRERSLIVLASLVTQGGAEPRLRPHVLWALEHGATPEELEALVALLAVYAGYPRASVGIEIVRDELRALGR